MYNFKLVGIRSFTSKAGKSYHIAHVSVPCSFDNFEGDQVMTAFIGDEEYNALTGHIGEDFEAHKILFSKKGQAGTIIGIIDKDGD